MTSQRNYNTRGAAEIEVSVSVGRTGLGESIRLRFRSKTTDAHLLIDMREIEAMRLYNELKALLFESSKVSA